MQIITTSILALSVLAGCSALEVNKPTKPIAELSLQCKMDQRFVAKTKETFSIKPFSFSVRIGQGGQNATVTMADQTFRARYGGVSSKTVNFMGRNAKGRVIITVPKNRNAGKSTFAQFGPTRLGGLNSIQAFYVGACR